MIEALIHRIKVKQAEIQAALAAGTPKTWEAYQAMVGEYRGLQAALDLLDAILEEQKNNY